MKLAWKTLGTAWWCALVFGLITGTLRLAIDQIAPPASPLALQGVSLEILWIAPLANLVIFSLLGIGLAALFRAFPAMPVKLVSTAVFVFVIVLGLLLVLPQIHRVGSLMLASGLAAVAVRWSAKRDWPLWKVSQTLPHAFALVMVIACGTFAVRHWQEWGAERRLQPAPGQPNVILVVVDTLRADRTSVYGYPRPTTPTLEEVGRQGAVFTRAISTSSWTLPSHISLMTGVSPDEMHSLHQPLQPSQTTLAEVLQQRGYRTGGFVANTGFGNRNMGLAKGFIRFDDFFHSVEDAFNRTTYGSRLLSRYYARFRPYDFPGRRRGADLIRDFWSWADRKPSSNPPFFAFLNLIETHHPYYLPDVSNSGDIGTMVGIQHGVPVSQDAYSRANKNPAVESWERDSYDRAVEHVDSLIASLMRGLQERGLSENTLLIITSDHGEALFDHDLFGHGKALYRETVHVPLLMRFPGKIPAGTREERPVSSAYVPGLILDLLGERGTFPGARMLPLGQAPTEADTAASFLEANPWGRKEWPNHSGWIKSVVTREWHLITYEDGRTELFQWNQDPHELNNLSNTPDGRVIVAALRSRLPASDTAKLASTQSAVRRDSE